MLKRRIIPCLDVKAGRVVKGVEFVQLRDIGDPVEIAQYYDASGADELVFLDITASTERRQTMLDVVSAVARKYSFRSPSEAGFGHSRTFRHYSKRELIKYR